MDIILAGFPLWSNNPTLTKGAAPPKNKGIRKKTDIRAIEIIIIVLISNIFLCDMCFILNSLVYKVNFKNIYKLEVNI